MIFYRSKEHKKGEDVILSSSSLASDIVHALTPLGYTQVIPCVDSEDDDHTCPWCQAQQFVMALIAATYPDQAGLSAVRKSQAATIAHLQEIDP